MNILLEEIDQNSVYIWITLLYLGVADLNTTLLFEY